MRPKVIKTEAEYDAAFARYRELADAEPEPGTPENDELELLALLIERYEDERYPFDDLDPIEAIQCRVKDEDLSQREVAEMLGGATQAAEVLARKRPLTLTMIRAVQERLGIPADVLVREPRVPVAEENEDAEKVSR